MTDIDALIARLRAPEPRKRSMIALADGIYDPDRLAAADALEQLQKDALRYRWLRDKSFKEPFAPGPIYRSLYDGIGGQAQGEDLKRVWLRFGEALDAAIDAAQEAK